jgi:precorrin-6Y C5,15-methyltransferase (decarboxylating)
MPWREGWISDLRICDNRHGLRPPLSVGLLMAKPWLSIIGIGEDGMEGLSLSARKTLEGAEVIFGGDRHHDLSVNAAAERIKWPSPFDAMIEQIKLMRGRRLVILVTGDPLWYSVGARILKAISADEITFYPQISAFQWAAVRMGWSIPDCETITVHGRADSQILPHLAPSVRLLVLTQNADTPASIAQLLTDRGFGQSRMVVLAALGGEREQRFESMAANWNHTVPDFHTLAIECVADINAQWYSRSGGLPDTAFASDGQITKQDVRAVTLAKLAPYPDAVLWDIGAGCGSISVEWMRSARGAQSIAVEFRADRIELIRQNMVALGVEKMELVKGKAPEILEGLQQPDAVFIGGGLGSPGLFDAAWSALRVGGWLVANAVTLESENRLSELHREYGGELARLSVHRAEEIGAHRGWRALMPVTQWSVQKTLSVNA